MEPIQHVLGAYAWYAILAFVVTVFATPIAAAFARAYGVMDMPDTYLKPHARPTPYLGGAAICLGWTVALLAAAAIEPLIDWALLLPVALGGVAMSVMGMLDDVREVPPKTRLLAGGVIITSVMVLTGAGMDLVDSVLYMVGIDAPLFVRRAVSLVVGVVIVLGACNSTNLIDGLDGLCAGVTGVISLGFFVIATFIAMHEWATAGTHLRLVIAMALFGAALGFLPFNFNPARIFMGDAGSILLGYNCGMMILLFAREGTLRWVIGGLMVFALPIFDTALAIFRRWRSGKPIFEGDRSHFYDQLVDRGLSVRKVVVISYSLSAFYALIGTLCIVIQLRYLVVLYTIVVLATIVAIFLAGMARRDPDADEQKPHVA